MIVGTGIGASPPLVGPLDDLEEEDFLVDLLRFLGVISLSFGSLPASADSFEGDKSAVLCYVA